MWLLCYWPTKHAKVFTDIWGIHFISFFFFFCDSHNNRLFLQWTSHSIDGYSLGYMEEIHALYVVNDEWVSATPIWKNDYTLKRLATQFHAYNWLANHCYKKHIWTACTDCMFRCKWETQKTEKLACKRSVVVLHWFGNNEAWEIEQRQIIALQYCRITNVSFKNQKLTFDGINSRQLKKQSEEAEITIEDIHCHNGHNDTKATQWV